MAEFPPSAERILGVWFPEIFQKSTVVVLVLFK